MPLARVLPFALALLFAAAAAPAAGQQPVGPRNNVYLELLGNGGLYSVNYERRFTERASFRGGLGHWTTEDWWSNAETTITSVPFGMSWLPGSGTRRLEVGGGLLVGRRGWKPSPGTTAENEGFASLTGVLGYRYQPVRSGWTFRAGFTPFFGFGDESAYPDRGFLPSLGVSGGYSF
jgi:hypothetical protein